MKHSDILRTNCLRHFYGRVRERIGPHIDPQVFARGIIEEMKKGRDSPALLFIARLGGGCARRVWRVTIDGTNHFIIYDHRLNAPVTVLLPSWTIKVARKNRFRHLHLENYL